MLSTFLCDFAFWLSSPTESHSLRLSSFRRHFSKQIYFGDDATKKSYRIGLKYVIQIHLTIETELLRTEPNRTAPFHADIPFERRADHLALM